ncbi:hypothetical protein [uncultured Nitrospira sp.]|uniref:hypothetical protein n=1 Tax=uncultured Nitrospira sp. TaxID=157176 RepID=UPI003140BEAD
MRLSRDCLYRAYTDRQLSEDILAVLIRTSFRLSSANMIFTSALLTDSGYIKSKSWVFSTTVSVTDHFKVSNRVTFLDYFHERFFPYYQ